jgi:alcohol dehydrogenase
MSAMKALVYLGPAKKALAKITKTTICGTDLHILKGEVPSRQPGRILGHGGVGIIEKVGPAVTTFKPGDRVLISCISACGKCVYCRMLMYSHCTTGSWILDNSIDGTQAEKELLTEKRCYSVRPIDLVLVDFALEEPRHAALQAADFGSKLS